MPLSSIIVDSAQRRFPQSERGLYAYRKRMSTKKWRRMIRRVRRGKTIELKPNGALPRRANLTLSVVPHGRDIGRRLWYSSLRERSEDIGPVADALVAAIGFAQGRPHAHLHNALIASLRITCNVFCDTWPTIPFRMSLRMPFPSGLAPLPLMKDMSG